MLVHLLPQVCVGFSQLRSASEHLYLKLRMGVAEAFLPNRFFSLGDS
jgi:hypothetical protein